MYDPLDAYNEIHNPAVERYKSISETIGLTSQASMIPDWTRRWIDEAQRAQGLHRLIDQTIGDRLAFSSVATSAFDALRIEQSSWLQELVSGKVGVGDIARDRYQSIAESVATGSASFYADIMRTIDPSLGLSRVMEEQLRQYNAIRGSTLSDLIASSALSRSDYFGGLQRTIEEITSHFAVPNAVDFAHQVTEELERSANSSSNLGFSQPVESRSAATDTFAAVISVARKRGISRSDWLSLLGVVVSILIAISQNSNGAKQDRDYRRLFEQTLLAIESVKDDVQTIRALPGTRIVDRPTLLFTKPTFRSRSSANLEVGEIVFVLSHRGPWVLVAVPASDESDGDVATGWVMKKYLRRIR